jgi:hypothetical protein
MTKLLVWCCPLCTKEDGTIERGSQEHLDLAIANHVIGHEQRAALVAVDQARLGCPSPTCDIGRNMHYNKSLGCAELKLTDFDRRLLNGMRIGGEKE